MESIYEYFNCWARIWCPFTHISSLGPGNGVHLHIFQFWGLGMVSTYTYFNLGAWTWGPFTYISNLGPGMVSIYTYFNSGTRNGFHLHIFQIWGLGMVSIYTYLRFGPPYPRCCLINSVNRTSQASFCFQDSLWASLGSAPWELDRPVGP